MVPGTVRILIGYAAPIDAAITTTKTASRHLAANEWRYRKYDLKWRRKETSNS